MSTRPRNTPCHEPTPPAPRPRRPIREEAGRDADARQCACAASAGRSARAGPLKPSPALRPQPPAAEADIRPGRRGRRPAAASGRREPPAGAEAPARRRPPQRRPAACRPIDQLQGRPIGRVLTKMGKVTREQVVEALDFQKSKGGALGRILIDLGYIKEADLNIAPGRPARLRAGQPRRRQASDPRRSPPSPRRSPRPTRCCPIEFDKATKKLTVVMASHENFRALDDLQQLMGYNVTAKIGDPEQIDKLIQQALQRRRRRHRRHPRRARTTTTRSRT